MTDKEQTLYFIYVKELFNNLEQALGCANGLIDPQTSHKTWYIVQIIDNINGALHSLKDLSQPIFNPMFEGDDDVS